MSNSIRNQFIWQISWGSSSERKTCKIIHENFFSEFLTSWIIQVLGRFFSNLKSFHEENWTISFIFKDITIRWKLYRPSCFSAGSRSIWPFHVVLFISGGSIFWGISTTNRKTFFSLHINFLVFKTTSQLDYITGRTLPGVVEIRNGKCKSSLFGPSELTNLKLKSIF